MKLSNYREKNSNFCKFRIHTQKTAPRETLRKEEKQSINALLFLFILSENKLNKDSGIKIRCSLCLWTI